MSPLDLIGRVTARRLRETVQANHGRAYYCMVGLDPAIVSAIARRVAAEKVVGGEVEVFVHPDLAEGDISPAVLCDRTAPWHRNHAGPGVRLTVCTVPARKMKETLPTLEHKAKIDDAWLLQDAEVWAQEGLVQCSEDIRAAFVHALKGLLAAGVAHDAATIADFVVRASGHLVREGLAPEKAVRRALPAVRLPSDCGDPRLKITESSDIALQFFRKALEEAQPALYLKSRDGAPLNRTELKKRLEQFDNERLLAADAATAIAALLADRAVFDGQWTKTQEVVAELGWEAIEAFFSDAKRKAKPNFGDETRNFFDRQFPNALTDAEKQLLSELTRDNAKPSEQIDDFFHNHKPRLQSDPRLFKRWERLVFHAPIETQDLAEGLLKLAHRAVPDTEDGDDNGDRVLIIRLRDAEKLDFWTRDKNTRVLRYLRDRYRGLDKMLAPRAVLDCGRCWEQDWENEVQENTSIKADAAALEFEAFVVPEDQVETVLATTGGRPHANRAQLIWSPPAEALGLSISLDLRRLRPENKDEATRLLTGRIHIDQSSRSSTPTVIDLAQRTSVIDTFGASDGLLANDGRSGDRIDLIWPKNLQDIEDRKIITAAQAAALREAYEAFHGKYGQALSALLRGEGVGAQSLIDQAELYGHLLTMVQTQAPQEISLRNLLAPLLSIGIISVESERAAALTAPWQPLRLAEMAAKSRQAAAAVQRIIASSLDQRGAVQDFAEDRAATLTATYYADVALSADEKCELLAETQMIADCSLLESVSDLARHGLSDEPADAAVTAFKRVADEYLKLRPHEQANFSVLILNADSENLPLAMANSLSRRIEENADLRCELAVTDDDPRRLRQVYERQNRRISYEIDATLASEAARNFLSRLRMGIMSPETLVHGGAKSSDIVLLQDVIARGSSVRWSKGDVDPTPPDLASYVPTARSKRRPFKRGNTTSALYLTAPRQPRACQAYVDCLYTVGAREVPSDNAPRLPIQEVAFTSGAVADVLTKAHDLGHWVMTFDRVADRRLVNTDERRIIRYFSVPGSSHNVIVSTEIDAKDLTDWISNDLDVILPGADAQTLAAVRQQLFARAAQLSGGVIMRGVQWSNHAHELLGVVLSQRELDRLLKTGRENHTGWFFLDDYRGWLDLTGEIADILAIDFSYGSEGPEIRLVVIEAKYVGQDDLRDQRRRSVGQLESTYTALQHRLLDPNSTLDPTIWRNRLADMVLEHMDPFDQVGGITQDQWLEGLRSGEINLTLDGHSIVFSHEVEALYETMPVLVDDEKPQAERRRLAQWVFARSTTAKALRDLGDDAAAPLLSIPAGWPAADNGEQQLNPAATVSALEEPPASAPTTPEPQPLALVSEDETPANDDPAQDLAEAVAHAGPWSLEISAVLTHLSRASNEAEGEAWLEKQIIALQGALQSEGMDAPVQGHRLTPNTGLIYIGGRTLTVGWLERKQTDFLTRYGLDIVRITPLAGQIAVGLRRPKRVTLHLADAWLRRTGEERSPAQTMAPLLGEKEDDGALCFLPLAGEYAGQDQAAPHSLVSGTTGSGKGILVTNLMLDLCALNAPEDIELYLIDPKKGVDYAWARNLPHLRDGIIADQDEAIALLTRLVDDMETRYADISAEGCRNIGHFNRIVAPHRRMPRVVIIFDEVANWMQDDEFKGSVDSLLNRIATLSRAAGFHLFMVYQRADNQVMTMQLRTNLGNKLILKLGDEGSSRIALNEKGAEKLLGKGHLIAKLDSDQKIYLQVPFIGDEEVEDLARAVIATWTTRRQDAAE
ncbi:hypothetical protein CFHF_21410 [Caulobacter flavus]|uniref:FtsK domain-containing protein n=1 Tax=Caulobacter flavus TaxID=1679497 RepID=A0A2N5CMX0_9CAUL|nr:FtsK/SpoIIIE domain-containing protein [Caulobacter flavus]AYV46557.1 hypothetical protein C1707_09935 [Caulobacter flavus]PLR07793.1 hypothetical protein CFHF_21410 [Caulobacter flavus]